MEGIVQVVANSIKNRRCCSEWDWSWMIDVVVCNRICGYSSFYRQHAGVQTTISIGCCKLRVVARRWDVSRGVDMLVLVLLFFFACYQMKVGAMRSFELLFFIN